MKYVGVEENRRDKEKSQGHNVIETKKYGKPVKENGKNETKRRRTNDDLIIKPRS